MMGFCTGLAECIVLSSSAKAHSRRSPILRQIDQFLDFSQIHDYLKSFYSHTGRPSMILS